MEESAATPALPRVAVVGGGLAGMVSALRLAQLGHSVTLYEANDRSGGKAGAVRHGTNFDEHGYHFFPLWYRNTWNLIAELRIADRFQDVEAFYHIHPGEFPNQIHKMANLGSVWSLWTNLTSGVLPFWEMVLFLYSNIDLASQKLGSTRLLDQITTAGFIHSRWYGDDILAQQHQELVLKGISEPSYYVSAKTMQKVIGFWFRYSKPMHRILKGNLQQEFIEPLQSRLEQAKVDIRFGKRVQDLLVGEPRADGTRVIERIKVVDTNSGQGEWVNVDQLILAIPIEQLRTLLGNDDLHRSAPELFGIQHLRTVPMAALNLYLNRRLPDIPHGHVNLIDSPFGLSFIDVSQFWPGKYNTTVLNMIASDFTSIQTLSEDEVVRLLVGDLKRYIPTLRAEDIQSHQLLTNATEPLFMNDVGIWHFRPQAKTCIPNLFMAGDYCRSYVDLVSMEGAITTALLAVKELRERTRLPAEFMIESVTVSQWLFRLLTWVLWPVAVIAKLNTLAEKRHYQPPPARCPHSAEQAS
jgi:uncharacterized protein with NAD-binding domain and iron-sulfur cluster